MSRFTNFSGLYPKGQKVAINIHIPSRSANALLILSRQTGGSAADLVRVAIERLVTDQQERGYLDQVIPEGDPEPEPWTPPEPEPPAPDQSLLADIDPASVSLSPTVAAAPGDCLVTALRRRGGPE